MFGMAIVLCNIHMLYEVTGDQPATTGGLVCISLTLSQLDAYYHIWLADLTGWAG